MTKENYFLYRHIRPDKNEVFYIGIGTISKTGKNSYQRAYVKNGKKKHWQNVVKSNPDYRIQIIFESDNYEFIIEKEKEFIKLYGRRDLGTGTLTNLTDGGEGLTNPGEKFREKMSELMKLKVGDKNNFYGKKHTEETKEKMSHKVLQIDFNGNIIKEHRGLTSACENTKFICALISKCCKLKRASHGGYIWIYKEDFSVELVKSCVNRVKQTRTVSVINIKNNVIIGKYNSVKNAHEATKESRTKINNHLKMGKIKKNSKYEWYYDIQTK